MADSGVDPAEVAPAPLWRMPFRPFFLAAATFGGIAIPIWVIYFQQGSPMGGLGLPWHVHEMIMGFAATTVLGFVLTAAQTWTGIRTVHGRPLAAMFCLWLLARCCWLLSPDLQWLGASADIVLFCWAAFIMGRMVYQSRNWRNAFFVPVFLVLALFSGAYAYALVQGDHDLARSLQNLVFYLIVHVVLVVGGRVIPFFSDRRLGRPETGRYPELEWLSLLSSLLFMLLITVSPDSPLLSGAAAFVAATHLLRWLSWKPWQTGRIPLLWSLYVAYAFIITGFTALAIGLPLSAAIHLIAVGGIGLMILAMISRVSLGHTARPLELPRGFAWVFIAIAVAALARALASLLPEFYFALLWLATAAWVAGFGAFLVVYIPVLTAPRADGGPG